MVGDTHDVINFFEMNANPLIVILGVAMGAILLGWSPVREWLRGIKMKQKRRQEIHQLLSQKYTEAIIDLRIEGHLTAEEAEEEGYRKLKQIYPTCKDLYPSEEKLKEKLERRQGKVDEALQAVSNRTPIAPAKKQLLFTRK